MLNKIVTVPADAAVSLEQLGSKRKFWFNRDDGDYLFKEGWPESGGHWAEVITCRICELLGIPHAKYQFAEYKNKIGVITKNFVPANGGLLFGNEMLAKMIPGYEKERTYRQRNYTLRVVVALLRTISPLIDIDGIFRRSRSIVDPVDVFIGYILLDMLVANQDRHHENWGIIVVPDRFLLAPTFDHASSLGHNELDERRKEILTTNDTRQSIESYSERAKSAFYSHIKHGMRMTTFDAFCYLAHIRPRASAYWIHKLKKITESILSEIIADIPEKLMSNICKEFAFRLLVHNKQRIEAKC